MTRRVLIVDDETNIRRMMRLTLEGDGYEVEDAEDGVKGLALFGDGTRFDAVLLDQKMPGLDGVQVLQKIRALAPGARVIMVTAFGTIELAVEAMKLGATDFLRKPLTPETLRAALAAALSKAPPAAQARPAPAPPPVALPSVEVWTVNGFFIHGLPARQTMAGNEHLFEIRHAVRGPQGEITVAVDSREMARVAREAGRPLAAGGAFWHQRAERAVVNHLFREGTLPRGNRLVVTHVDDDALRLARDWPKD